MICGVNLGILVVCLIQVECIYCLWEKQGSIFKKQNANTYNPFTQNRLRQASFSSGFDQSFNQGFSDGSYSEMASQLTQDDRSRDQDVLSTPILQEPKREVLEKWRLPASEIASVSFLRHYNPPSKSSRRYKSNVGQKETDALKTPVDLEEKVKTSATVRGKLVRSSKHPFNQKERIKGNQYWDMPQLSKSYTWGLPQNGKGASSVVTYRVPEDFGGSLIIRLKNKEYSEEVTPLDLQSLPQQTVFHRNQGRKYLKSVWRRVKPQSI